MAALWETLAFITGALGAHDLQNIGYATAHSLLFLLAPIWINGFVYMTFARLAYYFVPEKKVIVPAKSLAVYFVTLDVTCFVIQAVGGLMASPGASPDIIKTGIDVYMAGIGFQEFFILCFVLMMIKFQRRALELERLGGSVHPERSWRQLLYTLYAVLVLITVGLHLSTELSSY